MAKAIPAGPARLYCKHCGTRPTRVECVGRNHFAELFFEICGIDLCPEGNGAGVLEFTCGHKIDLTPQQCGVFMSALPEIKPHYAQHKNAWRLSANA